MPELEDVLAGTWCIEIAHLGDVAIPMRAIAESERALIERTARVVVMTKLPSAPRDELVEDAMWPALVARSALDPMRLRDGERAPLFRSSDVEAMPPTDVDELLRAQLRAQHRACPPLDGTGYRELHARMVALVRSDEYALDCIRARRAAITDFFRVASIHEVTRWQLLYWGEITR